VSHPSRILVRLPNWLGDVLLARPLLHELRRQAPTAEIHAVAPASLLELIAGEGRFDRGHSWPRDRGGRAALVDLMRAWRPERALVLPPSFSSAWFAWRTGARERIGYRSEGRSVLLTHALARPERGDVHLSREYLALAGASGTNGPVGSPPVPALHPTEAARATAAELAGRERSAVLGPGARYGPAKRWPLERFVALGRRLQASGYRTLICGAPDEREPCERVAASIGEGSRSLAGRTDLPTQLALLHGAALAVCNDSGLAHLAAASGTPTIVIFGSTSSAWTAPLGPRVRVVQRAPVCAPCFQRTCRIGYRCLTAITTEDVERTCREVAAG
jgi:heptosyltransferase-2